MDRLNPLNVPESFRPLIALAERWGIRDDCRRQLAVASATVKELRTLATCFDSVAADDLASWLTGPDSFRSSPSAEHLAFTCLTMAVHAAQEGLRASGKLPEPKREARRRQPRKR